MIEQSLSMPHPAAPKRGGKGGQVMLPPFLYAMRSHSWLILRDAYKDKYPKSVRKQKWWNMSLAAISARYLEPLPGFLGAELYALRKV